LIDLGLDILHPIQPEAMDVFRLKRELGRHLTLCGGVRTQELLPRGTADEVYRTTRELIDVMTSGGGGYILAASHAVPPETPLRNIFALY
jgi:uroporphyrinogen decarboxylase